MIADLYTLKSEVEAAYQGAQAELSLFPSGAGMLDVHLDGRMYVVVWRPEVGFELDDFTDDIGIGHPFGHRCNGPHDLWQTLRGLMSVHHFERPIEVSEEPLHA